MDSAAQPVRRLDHYEVPQVVDVLFESFYDYPVMRYVVGHDSVAYDAHLRALINFFVMARVLRSDPLLGIGESHLTAAAIVSNPTRSANPRELEEQRERLWNALGASARTRYESFGKACAPFQMDTPHLHVSMIGVRSATQGRGYGRRLMDAIHELSADESESVGVTLTTEVEANVAFYKHLGYQVVGAASVAPGLRTWGFFRPNDDYSSM
ncbi:MAG: GNAT family N-acetyltransferase [Rhodothermia bacterium]|nr:GNAT family N-acetyltransferase [Rhodothermia bacterium]